MPKKKTNSDKTKTATRKKKSTALAKSKTSMKKTKRASVSTKKVTKSKSRKSTKVKSVVSKKSKNKKLTKSKLNKRSTPSKINKSANSQDDFELRIFENQADDLGLDINNSEIAIIQESKAAEPAESFKQKIQTEAAEIPVNIKSERTNSSPYYYSHILDLKNQSHDDEKSDEYDFSFLAKFENNPQDTFQKVFTWSEGEYWADDKLVQNLRTIINLSILAWPIYLFINLYGFFKPILSVFVKSILFISVGFWEYLVSLFRFVKLIALSLVGRASLDSDSFLYPEKAFAKVSIFEKEKSTGFGFSPLTFKSAGLFILIAMVVVLPIKGLALLDDVNMEKERVLGASETAYSSLQMALEDIQTFSWISAADHFADSRGQFTELQEEFNNSNSYLKNFLMLVPFVKQKLKTAESMVAIGIDVSQLGEELTKLLHLLQTNDDKVTVTQKIAAIKKSINNIQNIETRINIAFAGVSPGSLPDDVREEVIMLQNTLPQLFASLEKVEDLMDFAYIILGGDKQQTYILIFQNSDELRPSGGFVGSLSTVEVYQGKVLDLDTPTGGPYEWQGWLTAKTIAPQPLWIVNPVWQFQDANWFYNYPTTVEKILSFYYQTRTDVVDGVVSINSYVLPEILKIVGDVEMPEYDKVLTPDNVLLEIQKAVELEYDKETNQPKKIIGDLFKIILERLTEDKEGNFIKLLELANKSLLERDIQLFFTDSSLQSQVTEWGWNGGVVETEGDYLAVINTNIAGAKTDKFMLQDMSLVSEINQAGEIINTLTISRTNDGIPGDIFYGHNNVDYLRVYVPQGSELLDAYGNFEPPAEEYFELPPADAVKDKLLSSIELNTRYDGSTGVRISDEFGKTSFGSWLQTNLGETSSVTFKYRLPFKVKTIDVGTGNSLISEFNSLLNNFGFNIEQGNKNWHTFYWQKQSGQHNSNAIYTVKYPSEWVIDYTSVPGFNDSGALEYQTPLDRDFNNGILFSID